MCKTATSSVFSLCQCIFHGYDGAILPSQVLVFELDGLNSWPYMNYADGHSIVGFLLVTLLRFVVLNRCHEISTVPRTSPHLLGLRQCL